MSMGAKKLLAVLVVAILPVIFGGCQKQAAYPNCKKDADCRVDASGKELNGVCYMGKCEECAADTDCSDLKQCVNNRCLASCSADADCGANNHCENNYCVADCTGPEGCASGQACAQGRCVAQAEGGEGACAISPVHFDFDQYNVKPEYKGQIDAAAMCLESNPEVKLTIKGHTDNKGTPAYNMALGERRANAVLRELEAKGIARSRITTLSLGEQEPLVDENSDHAAQQNRRAEFVPSR